MSARKDSRPYGGAVPADTGWLVVQTKRHKERAVQAALARGDFPTYLPLLRQWPRSTVGGEVGPMFPGYVFCQPDPIWLSGVASCNRALRLVSFGDAPPAWDRGSSPTRDRVARTRRGDAPRESPPFDGTLPAPSAATRTPTLASTRRRRASLSRCHAMFPCGCS
jgi:Transcription termination factor nusG